MRTPNVLSHHGYAVSRTPLLTLEELDTISAQLSAAKDESHGARIILILENEKVALAMKLGAPGLYRRICEKDPNALGKNDEIAVLKYLTRMATRATPFAGFAAVGLVVLEGAPPTIRADNAGCGLRLDSGLLNSVHEQIRRKLLIAGQPLLRRNKTAQLHSDALRYFERHYVAGRYQFSLSQVDISQPLQSLLAFTTVPRTFDAISKHLRDIDDELDDAAAIAFIKELVKHSILEVDLNVPMFGPDPLGKYIQALESLDHPSITEEKEWLKKAHQRIAQKNRYTQHETLDVLRDIAAIVPTNGQQTPQDGLVHIDSFVDPIYKPLPSDLMPQLERAIRLVASMFPTTRFAPLVEFESAFLERFGDEFVPLLVALDPERGVPFGYSASIIPWTNGLQLEPKREMVQRTHADAILAKLLSAGNYAIDLSRLPLVPALLDGAKSFAVNISLFAAPTSNSEPLAYLHYVSSPGATNLLTRFGARDSEIATQIERSLALDFAIEPGRIIAEIAHCPHPRSGNVLARPDLFKYTIHLSGDPGAGRTINVDDLYLGVVNGRLTLRSLELDAEIIPRSTSAYNYHGTGNLGIYQFLCALGRQNVVPTFRWPEVLSQAEFLPRVCCGQIVLAAARWRIPKSACVNIATAIGCANMELARHHMNVQRLPRYVSVDQGDQKLEIDLLSDAALNMLGSLINVKEDLIIAESVCRMAPCHTASNAGPKHSEWVLPLTLPPLSKTEGNQSTFPAHGIEITTSTAAGSGDVWRYIKVYGGEETLKQLITNTVVPLLRSYKSEGRLDKWHFLRYRDPNFHFRIRILGAPEAVDRVVQKMFSEVFEPLIIDKRLARFQSDIYLPEIRRYGGERMLPLAETIFMIDSDFAADLFMLEREQGDDAPLWQGALAATLQNVKLYVPLSAQANFIKAERDRFMSEFEITSTNREAISKKYKLVRPIVEKAVAEPTLFSPILSGALTRRAHALGRALASHPGAATLTSFPASFVSGVTHMMANRVLTSSSRFQEFIIYEFIDRAARSLKARG